MKKQQTKQGFTLIETLVAISILVVAITAPLSLSSQSLFAAFYAKDQVIASYLAQEAIEIVRQRRDHHLMLILDSTNPVRSDWLVWQDGILSGNSATLRVDAKDLSITSCASISSDCARLQHDGTLYTHDTNFDDTRFKRIVVINKSLSNPDEIELRATVEWQTRSFKPRSFTITETLYNWLPQ